MEEENKKFKKYEIVMGGMPYIPISVIQEKIETLELIIKQINEDNPTENVQEYQTQIEILQELLKERNK